MNCTLHFVGIVRSCLHLTWTFLSIPFFRLKTFKQLSELSIQQGLAWTFKKFSSAHGVNSYSLDLFSLTNPEYYKTTISMSKGGLDALVSVFASINVKLTEMMIQFGTTTRLK